MSTRARMSMDLMTETTLVPENLRAERGSGARPNAAAIARKAGAPVLDVVVPVYNEQTALAASIRRLHCYLRDSVPFPARITIADNASVDDTARIAAQLATE